MTRYDLPAMIRAYIECALWAGLDENGEDCPSPLDKKYGPDDVTEECRATVEKECRAFYRENAADLSEIDAGQAGHDFHLTRNRHGAGFWDRGLGEIGQRLTDACRPYGEDTWYAHDGRVYNR